MYSGSSDSGGSTGSRHSNSQARTVYKCKICGNGFNSGQSLGGHMNVHRGRGPRSSKSSAPPAAAADHSVSYDSNSTSFKGVRLRAEQHKWVAEIRPPKSNKTWWLGTYSTPVEAAYAYDVAIIYFGSETSLNFENNPVYDQIPRISSSLPKQDFAVQLRKVVKEYGKLAMQSHRQTSEFGDDNEDEGSTSWNGQYNNDSPFQQPEESSSATREIDWDEFPDSFPAASFSATYDHDTPFDFEMAPPATFEYNSYTGNYPPFAASDYAPSGVYSHYQPPSEYETSGNNYNHVTPPVHSEYEYCVNQMPAAAVPSDHYGPSVQYNLFNGYQPQQQFWSTF